MLWVVSLPFVVELSPTVEKNGLIYSPVHPPVPFLGPKKGANYKETPITLFFAAKESVSYINGSLIDREQWAAY